jgi:sugar/nucleoside kinase (ribokinase family)
MEEKKYNVLGVGNALVDILVKVSDNVLENLQLTKGQFHSVNGAESEKVLNNIKYSQATISPGGSAGNTIATIALLGGKTAFCGKIGNDNFGRLYEMESINDGVIPLLGKSNSSTGYCVVFITPDAERTFAVNLGASVEMVTDDVREEDVKHCEILHIDGYQVEQAQETCLHALELAKKNGVVVSVDVSDPGVVSRNKNLFIGIVKKYADIVFANEDEARVLTDEEPEQAISVLGEWCNTAVVKCGKLGSLISVDGVVTMIQAVQTSYAIDTTGAGDAYAAGFLFGRTRRMNVEDSGKLASQLGAKIVEKVGARLSKEEIRKVIEH